MKGTKLWQAPGSPIIQGRSRLKRPFLNVWAYAAAIAASVVLGAATLALWFLGAQGASLTESLLDGMTWLVPALPGILGGSAAGVGVARLLGTRRVRTAGAIAGILLGIVSVLVIAPDLIFKGALFT